MSTVYEEVRIFFCFSIIHCNENVLDNYFHHNIQHMNSKIQDIRMRGPVTDSICDVQSFSITFLQHFTIRSDIMSDLGGVIINEL